MSETELPPVIAGENAILARRYAHALFELAEEQKQIDAVGADLRALRGVLRGNATFQRLTGDPRLTRPQLVQIMKKVADAAKLGDLTHRFLARVAQNRRLMFLQDIIDVFLVRWAKKRGEYVAEVDTARSLTPEQKEVLAAQLAKVTGGTVKMIVKEDPRLLGGLKIKVGSRLIDVSVEGKLARIERALKSKQEAA